jgi:invasion protein IalB
MGMTHLTVILAAFAIAWLPASCSKSQNSKAALAKTAPKASVGNAAGNTPASAIEKNTGDAGGLSLTNNSETLIHLGAGKICRIKPVMLDEKNLQLTLALEIKKTDGQMQSLIITQVVTPPGKPFEIVMGGTDIALTPIIVE